MRCWWPPGPATALKAARKNIVAAITMPGMGTGDRTKSNAWKLMEALKVTAREIPIEAAVKQHFKDIGQDENTHDTTYENCQARERTQILMDYANKIGGIVLGTGRYERDGHRFLHLRRRPYEHVQRQLLHPQNFGQAAGAPHQRARL